MGRAKKRVASSVGQRGQAAVFTALGMFTLVLFTALAVNTGIVVNDKIRMQDTADLTAYSGAYTQATYMNQMAAMNENIYETVQRLRAVLNYGPAYMVSDTPDDLPTFYWKQDPCTCLPYSPDAQAKIDVFQSRIDTMYDEIVRLNKAALADVELASKYTAQKNFLGNSAWSSNGSLSFFKGVPGSPANPRTGAEDGMINIERLDTADANVTQVGYNYLRSCPCCDGCCEYPQQHIEGIDSWVYKVDDGKLYWPVKVKGVPVKNFVDTSARGGPYFGADASTSSSDSDYIYGYAAAKPYEGMLGTSDPDNRNEGGSFIPQNPIYPPSDDLQNIGGTLSVNENTGTTDYFRATYRARLMGMQEQVGSSTGSAKMVDLVQRDPSEPQFQDKVNYFAH